MNPPDKPTPTPNLSPTAKAALNDISDAVYACVRRMMEKEREEEERRRVAQASGTTPEENIV
jgi:hypothetical protein